MGLYAAVGDDLSRLESGVTHNPTKKVAILATRENHASASRMDIGSQRWSNNVIDFNGENWRVVV